MIFFNALIAASGSVIESIPYPETHQIGILFAGQSNAQGSHSDTPPNYLQNPLNGVYIRNSGTWEILDYPNNQQSSTSTGFAAELSLGYELQKHFNRDVYISKYGVSSAPIYNDPERTDFNIGSNEAYPTLKTYAIALRDKIESLGKIPIIIMVWVQGEGDQQTLEAANNYGNNLTDIVNGLNAEGAGINYYIINKLKLSPILNEERSQIIMQQQEDWCNSRSNAFVLDMSPYTFRSDNLHFNGVSQVLIGEAVKDIIVNQILL